MASFGKKVKTALKFISLLKPEVCILLNMFAFSVRGIPFNQMLQDKICMQNYINDRQYCRDLAEITVEDDLKGYKIKILKDVTDMGLYFVLILTIPSVFWSLFIGPWMDKYPHARKILIIVYSIGATLEVILSGLNAYMFDWDVKWLLLAQLPSGLLGGLLVLFTSIFSYVAVTTPPKWRAMRLTIVELSMFSVSPVGITLSGKLLNMSPLFSDVQLHNYLIILLISGVINFLSFIWACFMIDEQKDRKRFYEEFSSEDNKSDIELSNVSSESRDIKTQKDNAKIEKDDARIEKGDLKIRKDDGNYYKEFENQNPIRLLFDCGNISEIVKTCFKKRPTLIRAQIWLMFLSMLVFNLSREGSYIFLFQFVERVYQWNAEQYSYASSISTLVNVIFLLTVVPFIIKFLKLKDTTLSLIGLVGYMLHAIIRGSILNAFGFFISILPNGFGPVTLIGMRAHLSKIIPQDEAGKIFSFMSSIDSIAPMISSAVFTIVFKESITDLPAACFFVQAVLVFIPIFVIFWIDLFTVVPSNDTKQNDKPHADVYEGTTNL